MENLPPHVLIFPFQAQGHVTSMLKLAELLSLSGLHVTFLLSHRLHARLLNTSDIKIRLARYSGLRIYTISDEIDGQGSGNNLDELIKSIAGMEGFLRRRDLPSICRLTDINDTNFQFLKNETQHTARARGFILNTFEELEGPILSQLRTKIPNLYTIGPLHLLLNARLKNKSILPEPASSTSLWEEDRSCLTWLDSQPLKSVLYVSFGSFTVTTKEQIMKFWHGLVNSGVKFLWVLRPDIVIGGGDDDWKSKIPKELEKGTFERGYIVKWAPQQEVLAHQAIGGFLTHSGWNSTLESIVAGKPMICWPYFADQQINSRFVGEVWKLGLDMKDTCDRSILEMMIKDLMEVKKNEFAESASRMAQSAENAVRHGGSSCCNLDRLIEDIKLMCLL